MEHLAPTSESTGGLIEAPLISRFVFDALQVCGVADEPAASVADALTQASVRGVDSHGIRLLLHYSTVCRTGRINPTASPSATTTGPATAVVDGGNGFGHHASFAAVDAGIALARASGIAAVSVINSSHFGAAGCYALRAADAGLVGMAFANSDPFVLPHDGIRPFHGTNPLAFAAPVRGQRPYLFDMATSVVPWNRVQDLASKGLELPLDVAVDAGGVPTISPAETAALLPIGGASFGYKGAGLAGMLEILSAVMTGSPHCSALLAMTGPDLATPRRLGHFFIVIDPDRFVPRAIYDAGMAAYLGDLRATPNRPGATVMAPGDREWRVEAERLKNGIPVAPALRTSFAKLADELGIAPPRYRAESVGEQLGVALGQNGQ